MPADGAEIRQAKRRGWALFLLTLVYLSNCMDRTIVAVLAEPLKTELALSNAELGLLGGLAFALFYSILGLPIARLAERYRRTLILSVCVAFWSGMTMLCATATGFVQLALYRMGVGVGEAGCSPTAHSLISDLYDRRRRASAMAVYSAGCSAGQILIAIAGSWVAQEYGWRTAFVLAGLPGLALALLISLSLPEPPRGGADRPEPGRPETVPVSSLTSLLAKLLRAPTIRHALAGAVVATMAGFGTHQFTAPFFIRVYEVSFSQAGLAFGLTVGLASALGLLLGGFLADRVARFDLRWYAGIPALGVALSCPLYILGFSQATWVAAVALLVVPGVLHFTYLPPTIAMLHNFVRANERASASALLLLLVSALGLGLGPWLAGLAIDHYVAELGSNALGTRRGLVVTSLLYLWAAAHYGRAAMTYLRDFRPEPAANTQAD